MTQRFNFAQSTLLGGVASPALGTDAANKTYVDNSIATSGFFYDNGFANLLIDNFTMIANASFSGTLSTLVINANDFSTAQDLVVYINDPTRSGLLHYRFVGSTIEFVPVTATAPLDSFLVTVTLSQPVNFTPGIVQGTVLQAFSTPVVQDLALDPSLTGVLSTNQLNRNLLTLSATSSGLAALNGACSVLANQINLPLANLIEYVAYGYALVVTCDGSANITVTSGSTTFISTGQAIYGVGVPGGATVLSITGNVIVASANIAATTVNIVVTFRPALGAPNPIDAVMVVPASGFTDNFQYGSGSGYIGDTQYIASSGTIDPRYGNAMRYVQDMPWNRTGLAFQLQNATMTFRVTTLSQVSSPSSFSSWIFSFIIANPVTNFNNVTNPTDQNDCIAFFNSGSDGNNFIWKIDPTVNAVETQLTDIGWQYDITLTGGTAWLFENRNPVDYVGSLTDYALMLSVRAAASGNNVMVAAPQFFNTTSDWGLVQTIYLQTTTGSGGAGSIAYNVPTFAPTTFITSSSSNAGTNTVFLLNDATGTFTIGTYIAFANTNNTYRYRVVSASFFTGTTTLTLATGLIVDVLGNVPVYLSANASQGNITSLQIGNYLSPTYDNQSLRIDAIPQLYENTPVAVDSGLATVAPAAVGDNFVLLPANSGGTFPVNSYISFDSANGGFRYLVLGISGTTETRIGFVPALQKSVAIGAACYVVNDALNTVPLSSISAGPNVTLTQLKGDLRFDSASPPTTQFSLPTPTITAFTINADFIIGATSVTVANDATLTFIGDSYISFNTNSSPSYIAPRYRVSSSTFTGGVTTINLSSPLVAAVPNGNATYLDADNPQGNINNLWLGNNITGTFERNNLRLDVASTFPQLNTPTPSLTLFTTSASASINATTVRLTGDATIAFAVGNYIAFSSSLNAIRYRVVTSTLATGITTLVITPGLASAIPTGAQTYIDNNLLSNSIAYLQVGAGLQYSYDQGNLRLDTTSQTTWQQYGTASAGTLTNAIVPPTTSFIVNGTSSLALNSLVSFSSNAALIYRVTGTAPSGSNTQINVSPDINEAVAASATVYLATPSTSAIYGTLSAGPNTQIALTGTDLQIGVANSPIFTSAKVLTTPSAATDLVRLSDLQAVQSGFTPQPSVKLIVLSTIGQIYTNGSGVGSSTIIGTPVSSTLVIDGYSVQLGDRLLLVSETGLVDALSNPVAANVANGLYTLTQLNNLTWTLTRTNTVLAFGNSYYGTNGQVAANQVWVNTTIGTITVGTTPIIYAQFSGAPSQTLQQVLNLGASASNVGTNVNTITLTDSVSGAQTILQGTRASTRSLVLTGSTSGNVTVKSAATVTTPYTITLPVAQGAAATQLTNDGSGNLSWQAPASGLIYQGGTFSDSGYTVANNQGQGVFIVAGNITTVFPVGTKIAFANNLSGNIYTVNFVQYPAVSASGFSILSVTPTVGTELVLSGNIIYFYVVGVSNVVSQISAGANLIGSYAGGNLTLSTTPATIETPVKYVATTNIGGTYVNNTGVSTATLTVTNNSSTPLAIDGYVLVDNDRVLLTNQSLVTGVAANVANGVYAVASNTATGPAVVIVYINNPTALASGGGFLTFTFTNFTSFDPSFTTGSVAEDTTAIGAITLAPTPNGWTKTVGANFFTLTATANGPRWSTQPTVTINENVTFWSPTVAISNSTFTSGTIGNCVFVRDYLPPVAQQAFVVNSGNSNFYSTWVNTTPDYPITVGTTPLTFGQLVKGGPPSLPIISYRLSNSFSVPNGVDTPIVYNTLYKNQGAVGLTYNTGNGVFTCTVGGIFLLNYQSAWQNGNTIGSRVSFLNTSVNGIRVGQNDISADNDFLTATGSGMWYANVGDTSQMVCWQNSGSTLGYGGGYAGIPAGYSAIVSFIRIA